MTTNTLRDAVAKLIKAKGRFHTEQNYAELVKTFDADATDPAATQPDPRVAELEAARIAYASEFPLTADGEPDVGNIHANIRKLKAQLFAATQPAVQAAPSDPYAAITLGNLKAGKLTAERLYVAYCELSGELKAANGAIKRYAALATPTAPERTIEAGDREVQEIYKAAFQIGVDRAADIYAAVAPAAPTAAQETLALPDLIVALDPPVLTNEGRATNEEEFGYYYDGYRQGFTDARGAAYELARQSPPTVTGSMRKAIDATRLATSSAAKGASDE